MTAILDQLFGAVADEADAAVGENGPLPPEVLSRHPIIAACNLTQPAHKVVDEYVMSVIGPSPVPRKNAFQFFLVHYREQGAVQIEQQRVAYRDQFLRVQAEVDSAGGTPSPDMQQQLHNAHKAMKQAEAQDTESYLKTVWHERVKGQPAEMIFESQAKADEIRFLQ